jgi:hypothetical protein
MTSKLICASAAFLLAGSAALAGPDATLSKDRLVTMISPAAAAKLQALAAKKGGSIFNNLATVYKDGLYWCCSAGTISGQDSIVGEQVVQGVPFTPKASKNATMITVAAAYVSGTNSMTVSPYSDNNNEPGTELASGTATNIETLGVCCGTASVKIPSTQLTKGTQYWVVLSSPDSSWEGWDDSETAQVNAQTIAYNQNNTGWQNYSSNVTFAMDVK